MSPIFRDIDLRDACIFILPVTNLNFSKFVEVILSFENKFNLILDFYIYFPTAINLALAVIKCGNKKIV